MNPSAHRTQKFDAIAIGNRTIRHIFTHGRRVQFGGRQQCKMQLDYMTCARSLRLHGLILCSSATLNFVRFSMHFLIAETSRWKTILIYVYAHIIKFALSLIFHNIQNGHSLICCDRCELLASRTVRFIVIITTESHHDIVCIQMPLGAYLLVYMVDAAW